MPCQKGTSDPSELKTWLRSLFWVLGKISDPLEGQEVLENAEFPPALSFDFFCSPLFLDCCPASDGELSALPGSLTEKQALRYQSFWKLGPRTPLTDSSVDLFFAYFLVRKEILLEFKRQTPG